MYPKVNMAPEEGADLMFKPGKRRGLAGELDTSGANGSFGEEI